MTRIRFDFQSSALPSKMLVLDAPDEVIETREAAQVPSCLERVEALGEEGYSAFGFVSYEAAAAFDCALATHPPLSEPPLLWFGLFAPQRALAAVEAAIEASAGPWRWEAALEVEHYRRRFERIQSAIREGYAYQVNLAFPMRPLQEAFYALCYDTLKRAQGAKYCALIETPEWTVLSLSPELFFERDGPRIRTRPMKGTRRRGLTWDEDVALQRDLATSAKDRAENLMVVDMLRNDLGRISAIGSVQVDALFQVEKYPTVWQMTSSVSARLREGIGLAAIFQALFPCASVTGAPKVAAMGLIRELEGCPRSVYCGAIGCVLPGQRAVFNVAIRTLTQFADGQASYRVGSGIVADSVMEEEYAECLAKAEVLDSSAPEEFRLLETLRVEQDGCVRLLQRHLDRLWRSARYFDYSIDLEQARRSIGIAARRALSESEGAAIALRLLLSKDGRLAVRRAKLPSPASSRELRLAPSPVDSRNPFLYHKTTHRVVYERARAETGESDVLLRNERGELTETTIANIALRRGGRWLTPPVSSGLLAGTMRGELLERGEIVEGVIRADELGPGEAIRCFNSLRGIFDLYLAGTETGVAAAK